MSDGLTPDEDQRLRTLHWLEEFGAELSDAHKSLKDEILARDKRTGIREPDVDLAVLPPEKPAADATPPADGLPERLAPVDLEPAGSGEQP